MAAGRRKPAEAEGGGNERWLLTYADLITLLLAFFIIMFAISNTDLVKYLLLKGSLQRSFNVGVLQGESSTSILNSGEQSSKGDVPDVPSPAASQVESQLQLLQEQEGQFKDAISFVGKREEGLEIDLAQTPKFTLFTSGSAELTPEGLSVMRGLVGILQPIPNHLRIEGYTDNIPTGLPGYPSNWELSGGRAVTLVRFLEASGVRAERLSAFGYGEQKPISDNDTPQGRASNRRVAIVVLNQETSSPPTFEGPAVGGSF